MNFETGPVPEAAERKVTLELVKPGIWKGCFDEDATVGGSVKLEETMYAKGFAPVSAEDMDAKGLPPLEEGWGYFKQPETATQEEE